MKVLKFIRDAAMVIGLLIWLWLYSRVMQIADKIGRFPTYLIIATITWLPVFFCPEHTWGQKLIYIALLILWIYFISALARWAAYYTESDIRHKVTVVLSDVLKSARKESETNS